jgi:septum formation protein
MKSLKLLLFISFLAFSIEKVSSHSRKIPILLAMSSSDQQQQQQQLLVSLRERLSNGNDDDKTALVLASQSPRRREILDMMGLSELYKVEPSPLDESRLQTELVEQNLPPTQYTQRLAEAKSYALAKSHLSSARGISLYLGSDTIVELDEHILEKPNDVDDAQRMLRMMSGRQHHVHTGVALYKLERTKDGGSDEDNNIVLIDSFVDTATVQFTDLSEQDIKAYIESGEPMDKAGSYGIQGIGGQFVTSIIGDFFTVMGLPMHRTSKLIAQALIQEQEKQEQ